MNLSLSTTQNAATSQIINNSGQGKAPSAETKPETTNLRAEAAKLAEAPFNLNDAAQVLISNLSQNGGKVEGLQVIAKNTQQDLKQKDNQKETDTFTARFQGHPITISIEKELILTADGSKDKENKVGIPNKVTISSESHGSISTTSQELGGKKQDSYIGEGKLNLINFNLNKLVPKETK
jgi:hypothetical protein